MMNLWNNKNIYVLFNRSIFLYLGEIVNIITE